MSVPVREVTCPTCRAVPWEACTQPTNTGRRPVTWFHDSRQDLAAEAEPPRPPATRLEIVARAMLIALQNDSSVSMVSCECGIDLDITPETVTEQMADLLEHAAHEHTGRRDVFVYRAEKLFSGYELGVTLRLDALTEAEQKWREERRDSIT